MTRQEFIDEFGEAPEDMFGPDWKNEVEELLNNESENEL